MSKELTVIERAIKALDVKEATLRELVQESVEIVTVTNQAGFSQAQTARMKLRTARVSLEKLGKAAREDATAFSKAVIEKEKQYISILTPEETRLQNLQDEFTAKIEAENQAKIQAEIDRKRTIQDAIDELSANLQFGDTSNSIQLKIDRITSIELDDNVFQERLTEAKTKWNDELEKLVEALEQTKEIEKAKADQAAAIEVLRKQEEMERIAREKAEKEVAQERANVEAAEKRERDRLAEIARKEAEVQRAEEERKAKEERAEIEKQRAEEKSKRIAAEHEAERLRAEAKALIDKKEADNAARIEAERKAASAPDKERMLSYAEALLALPIPKMSTVEGESAALGIKQAVVSLYKRITAKAEEL